MQVMVVTMSSIEFVDIIDNSGGGRENPVRRSIVIKNWGVEREIMSN